MVYLELLKLLAFTATSWPILVHPSELVMQITTHTHKHKIYDHLQQPPARKNISLNQDHTANIKL